ncbi:MAG: hypothetical protein EP312_08120 [Gammaproteobacteria bacterium]|nr:MAG: hypothetical protein EP312_08120 [Gammaproteobacteria bacterium]
MPAVFVSPSLESRHYFLISLLLAAGIAQAAWLGLATPGLPIDDAWIHLVYVRNLLEHGVFGYNPGEWENGSTAPLWVLLITPLAAVIGPVSAAKWMGVLSLVALATGAWVLGRRLLGPWAAILAAFVISWDPWLAELAVSGMEPVAASAALLWLCVTLQQRNWFAAGLLAAVAILLRPESGLWLPAAMIVLLLDADARRQVSAWAALCLPSLLVVGGWMFYSWTLSGLPMPNTFVQKVYLPSQPLQWHDQLGLFHMLYLSPHWWVSIPAVLLLMAGVWQLLRRLSPMSWVLVIAPVGLLLFTLGYVKLGGGYASAPQGWLPNTYFARYALFLRPWFLLLLCFGIVQCWQWLSQRSVHRMPIISKALLLLVMLVPILMSWQAVRANINRHYQAHCHEMEQMHGNVGQWLASVLPADAVVAVSDAGRLRYELPTQQVVDLVGLNSVPMLQVYAYGIDWLSMVHALGVQYFAVWPDWHPQLQDARVRLEPLAVYGRKNSVLFPVEGTYDEMVIYRAHWQGE